MRGPAPRISSSASVDLTLYQSRPESLLGFHSYLEPSHNEVLACCSWLMLLYIEAVDRYANRRGFLSLLLRCCDRKSSLLKARQLIDHQAETVRLPTFLFYLKESQTVSERLQEWNESDHERALVDGFRSPLLETHGKNFPQHSPSRIARNAVRAYEALAFPCPAESSAVGNRQRHNGGTHKEHHNLQADALLRRLDNSQTRCRKSPQLGRRTTIQCPNFKNSVFQTGKCPEFNNTNCGLSYTSRTGPPLPSSSICSPIAVEVASQSLQPFDAVVVYALWRSEGNWGYDLCGDSPPREVVGLARVICFSCTADHPVCDSVVGNAIEP